MNIFDFEEQRQNALKLVEAQRLISLNTKPYARPSKDYSSSCISYKTKRDTHLNIYVPKLNMASIKSIQLTEKRHCSTRRLDELEPIRLNDMMVNKRHIGKFLICRVLPNPYLMPAMHFLVQDEDGEVDDLAIHHYTATYDLDPVDVYPENTVIAIKEPYLKISIHDQSKYYIQVTSPTDVVVLDDDHCVAKWKTHNLRCSFDELNEHGNRFYVAKKYAKAIGKYTEALKV